MTIQWFPGHMAKTFRLVSEHLKYIDIIFELRDARIPYSSSNPKIEEQIKNKPRLIILTKQNKADEKRTKLWMAYYEEQGIKAIAIDSLANLNPTVLVKAAREVLKPQILKESEKGIKTHPIRAMIIGIPNVGKSTLINSLTKKKATQTGDKPGVTKSLQWINIKEDLQLLDTPGVLWPKFEDQEVGLKLAITGAIKDQILPLDEVVMYAIDYLKHHYPERLINRYKLIELPDDNVEILNAIGRVRGCLISGNRVNYDKVIELLLYEIRTDQLGALTFECPTDIKKTSL